MTQLLRLKLTWTGFTGGPGYTNLHFGVAGAAEGAWINDTAISECVAKVDSFLGSLISRLPATATVNCDKTAEVIQISNGSLISFKNVSPVARTAGTGTGNYSAASGAVINWYTDGVRRGRRVRGRTFLVPLAGSALAANGTLNDTDVTGLSTAATALSTPTTSGAQLHVWGRPTPVLDANGKATGETTPDGVAFPVTSVRIPDKVAIMRSRRD